MELFEGLTASEIDYLQYLQKQGYFDGIEMFFNLDPSSDYRIDKLVNNGYIILQDNGPYSGSSFVTITEKGVAALIDYEKHRKSENLDKKYAAVSLIVAVMGVILAALALIK